MGIVQGNRMNAIVVGSLEYSFTVNWLRRGVGCSQGIDLCSFLSFWSVPWRRECVAAKHAPDTELERIRQIAKRFAVTHPRWEPYALIGHVRFCAGGAQ